MKRMAGNLVSLRERLLIFFSSNPETQLCIEDLSNKFPAYRHKQISATVRLMWKGDLLCAEQGRHKLFYSAGPILLEELGYDDTEIAAKRASSVSQGSGKYGPRAAAA